MESQASERRRAANPGASEAAQAADDLLLALDPAAGVLDRLTPLSPRDVGLPIVVRARLPERADGVARHLFGRGSSPDDAVVSAVSAGFERHALDELAGKRGAITAHVIGTGARTQIDVERVLAYGGIGCGPALAGAVEHATLEAFDRRALPRALAAGRFEGRLDERSAPLAVGRVLEWHRGRGCQVTSVLVGPPADALDGRRRGAPLSADAWDRGPPVVACFAVPPVASQAIVVGVAAARTCGGAWRAAATELHQVFLARARRDQLGNVRPGGIPTDAGDLVALGRAFASGRADLLRALGETRRVIEAGTLPPWSRTVDAVAVELTTAAASKFGRRVVAVVLGEGATVAG